MSGLTWGKPNNTLHTGIFIFEFTTLLFVTGINADTWGRQQIAAQPQIHQCMICSSSSSLGSGTYPWQWVQPMEWFCHSKWLYTRIYIYTHTLILSLSLYIYIYIYTHVVRRAILTQTCTHFGCWQLPSPFVFGRSAEPGGPFGGLTPPSMEVTKINEPSDGHANFSTCVHQTKPIHWSIYMD